jgi:IS5 family transposase
MNKYLAPSNKPRTRSKATKNLPTLSQHRRRREPQDAGSNRAKEDIDVASLQTAGGHANENRRAGDRRRAWKGGFADGLGCRRRRSGLCFDDHVVAAVIVRSRGAL